MKTPVVLIIYNRPEQAKLVFDAIKKSKPTKLYIFADGGKDEEDAELCKEAQTIINNIDWEVNLQINISKTNMGCFNRIITGLEVVFSREESAIILEDDCIPDITFFTYCEYLLNYYKSDETILHISGCNILGQVEDKSSYFFSNYV